MATLNNSRNCRSQFQCYKKGFNLYCVFMYAPSENDETHCDVTNRLCYILLAMNKYKVTNAMSNMYMGKTATVYTTVVLF